MSVFSDIRKIMRVTASGSRAVARGVQTTAVRTVAVSRWVGRNVEVVRQVSGSGNASFMRLLDLHAISCAGDTLIVMGLIGSLLFARPGDQIRLPVILALLATMIPVLLLAPVIGPIADRFRHGRRYAIAATMAGRLILAWVIGAGVTGAGLYAAAFGVLGLSRMYAISRAAAVARMLPGTLGLSQAGARSTVYATLAAAVIAPVGAAVYWIGPVWPPRLAGLVFAVGVALAFSLPPRGETDAVEVPPRLPWVPAGRFGTDPGGLVFSGRLSRVTVITAAAVRWVYGFLVLVVALAIQEGSVSTVLHGTTLSRPVAVALLGATIAIGAFVATIIGTWLSIRRPVALQVCGVALVGAAAATHLVRGGLGSLFLVCFAMAVAAPLARMAVDATTGDRTVTAVRPSAFARTEMILLLVWLVGATVGVIPVSVTVGVIVVATLMVGLAVYTGWSAWALRDDVLRGRPTTPLEAYPASAPTLLDPYLAAAVSGAGDATGTTDATVPVTAAGLADPTRTMPTVSAQRTPDATETRTQPVSEAPPGFHLFRPSTKDDSPGSGI